MSDIGRLERRLTNVETYTQLSLLETDTASLNIVDAKTGLDRFKSGFFVDNFRSHTGQALDHPSSRCSIDKKSGELRPSHYTHGLDLLIGSEQVRKESWQRKFTGEDIIKKAKPNTGHKAISKIIRDHGSAYLITQNVDNLHQDAGVSEENITEIHGNATYATCLDCSKRYELEDIKKVFFKKKEAPYCDNCGGIIKTATISFGQSMPEEGMIIAQRKTLACDLFITIGTSLVVYPAAGFPKLAKDIGARLVIINNEPTDFDSIADLVIHEQIGEVFSDF